MNIDSISRIYSQNNSLDMIKDYRQIRAVFSKNNDNNIEELPWWAGKITEENKSNDFICAKSLVSLAILNGPTDLDDIFSAYKQIKSGFKEKKPNGYDPKKAQHPFSFFRGTILHEYFNPNSEKCISKNLAKKIIKNDVSLRDTKFGAWILKKLGVEEIGRLQTKIPSIYHTHENPDFVHAKVYKSKTQFGDLTARALSRTPKIAIGVLTGLEGVHAAYNIMDGKDTKRELARAATEVSATVLSMGYLGAIGYKHYAACGSLVGMGIGSLVGENISEYIFHDAEDK